MEISVPTYDTDAHQFMIKAFDANDQQAPLGSICYEPHNSFNGNNSWNMKKIWVTPEYRRNGCGFALFDAFITDIKNKNSKEATWAVIPTEKDISTHQLVTTYSHWISKLNPPIEVSMKDIGPESCSYTRITITWD